MIYTDCLGKKQYRRYVVILDMNPEIICCGIYDSYFDAVGHIMNFIWEMAESYKKDGDEFEIGLPEELEDGGETILITFKHHAWKESCWERYYILEYEERIKDGDSNEE